MLLRNARHHTWGFPKGKLHAGEDARAGALRELHEETAIDAVEIDDAFSAESVYELPPDGRGTGDDDEPVKKRVRYFAGRVRNRDFTRSPEHDAGDWMRPEEVASLIRHEDTRRIFREALARAVRFAGASGVAEPTVFVASLNEWSEGHALEPDVRFGMGWLEAVRDGKGRG